jgi:NodT family efflux transporter outer membrane factor (OMF) lipoprotein
VRRGIGALGIVVLLAGCTVGPNYKRPKVDLPGEFRGTQPDPHSDVSIAETKWADLFGDETLTKIVDTALSRNFDLAIAAERVQEARAQLGIVRANLYPFIDAQASFTAQRSSSLGTFTFLPRGVVLGASYTQLGLSLSWEADVFGRLRRLSEAARAQYLASQETRQAITVSLISQVMGGYFQLREQDLELDISGKTRDVAQDGLRLTNLRHDRGAVSALDVHQAEQLLYTATSQMAAARRNIAQTENALSLLQAEAPAAQPRGKALEDLPLPPQVPAGLPSALLERRPDIRAAEQTLVSANAQIGAARALYFPQFSLTAFAGGQSRFLSQIATSPARVYSVAPTALQSIFHAGQIRNQVRLAEAQQREQLITYQRTIYTALREVSDALIAHERIRDQRHEQEQLVHALSESARLSTVRYKGGLDSYLQVLDSQRNLFQGQLALSQLRLAELLSVVQLYGALGGGWQ